METSDPSVVHVWSKQLIRFKVYHEISASHRCADELRPMPASDHSGRKQLRAHTC